MSISAILSASSLFMIAVVAEVVACAGELEEVGALLLISCCSSQPVTARTEHIASAAAVNRVMFFITLIPFENGITFF